METVHARHIQLVVLGTNEVEVLYVPRIVAAELHILLPCLLIPPHGIVEVVVVGILVGEERHHIALSE